MVSFFIGLVGAIIALVGWFGFKSVTFLIVGMVLYIIETAIEWRELNANAKMLDIVVFIIGCAVAAVFTSAPWYVGGIVAIAIYSLFLRIVGLISMLIINALHTEKAPQDLEFCKDVSYALFI